VRLNLGRLRVCDYEAQAATPRRVSIIDAFHGEEKRRHGR
jgi:hypothetical protein